MYTQHTTSVGEDTPIVILQPECVAKTIDAFGAQVRRRPIIQPGWRSLQEAALCGNSEQRLSSFVKCGIASEHFLFSGSARRFGRSDIRGWNAAGVANAYAAKGVPGAVRE